MSNLWIFGDSFSYVNSSHPDKNSWLFLLSDKLNVDSIRNYSAFGASNSWIYYNFKQHINEIEPDDYVIVQITDPYRQWFVKKSPTVGNLATLMSLTDSELADLNVSQEVKTAVQQYLTYLFHDDLADVEFTQTVESLLYLKISMQLKNMRIISSTRQIPGTKGTLLDVCLNEFASDDHAKLWYEHYGVDPRLNHLSPNNHAILSKKLFIFLNDDRAILDLSSDFDTKFLKLEL